MKILLISSSPHKEKSQTLLLAKQVLKGCSGSVKTEVMHLCDFKIEFCRHCDECHKKIMNCSIEDDVHIILKKMLEADAIILASPNYISQVTASMKAFLDRSSHFIHCIRLLDKYIVGVVSSGGGQDKDVLDYIGYYGNICGAQYAGGVSSRTPISKEKMVEALKLGSKLTSDIKEKRTFPEQMKIIEEVREYFKKVIQARKNEWVEEYQYWQDKDWL